MTSLLDFVLYPGSNHYVKDVHVFAMRYPETYRLYASSSILHFLPESQSCCIVYHIQRENSSA
jgi:hypothetical protein